MSRIASGQTRETGKPDLASPSMRRDATGLPPLTQSSRAAADGEDGTSPLPGGGKGRDLADLNRVRDESTHPYQA